MSSLSHVGLDIWDTAPPLPPKPPISTANAVGASLPSGRFDVHHQTDNRDTLMQNMQAELAALNSASRNTDTEQAQGHNIRLQAASSYPPETNRAVVPPPPRAPASTLTGSYATSAVQAAPTRMPPPAPNPMRPPPVELSKTAMKHASPPLVSSHPEFNKICKTLKGLCYDMAHWDQLPYTNSYDNFKFICTRDNRYRYILTVISILLFVAALSFAVYRSLRKNVPKHPYMVDPSGYFLNRGYPYPPSYPPPYVPPYAPHISHPIFCNTPIQQK